MTNPEAKAKLQALSRAYQIEKISETIAAVLDALPEKYPPDLLEDALTRALTLHMTWRFEAYHHATDNPMDEDKPHG